MPIRECTDNGEPGFKWGILGKCFTYTNETNKQSARDKATEQGRAIEANKHEGGTS